ncbi:MAG: leucine-rich repeat domain-containing protein, partial [Christensenellaceae bacterium]
NLNNVRELGERAFTNCSALKEIVIPDSVVTIGPEAFSVASALESVTLGKGVETIGNSAFYQCLALKSIIFAGEGNLKKIDNAAFSHTAFSEISLPEGLTDIGNNAFFNCEELAEVSIPDSVTHVGAYAFEETKIYSLQASETYIYADDWLVGVNEGQKSSIENITEDSLKDGVTGIADWALSRIENLLTVDIPSTVKGSEVIRSVSEIVAGNYSRK